VVLVPPDLYTSLQNQFSSPSDTVTLRLKYAHGSELSGYPCISVVKDTEEKASSVKHIYVHIHTQTCYRKVRYNGTTVSLE